MEIYEICWAYQRAGERDRDGEEDGMILLDNQSMHARYQNLFFTQATMKYILCAYLDPLDNNRMDIL